MGGYTCENVATSMGTNKDGTIVKLFHCFIYRLYRNSSHNIAVLCHVHYSLPFMIIMKCCYTTETLLSLLNKLKA